jgi:acylphosphatase
MNDSRRRARVVISGFVQGVGYRYATRGRAVSLGVTGWVRNRPDGRVEAVFEGESEHVESMVRWCRRGPSGASVEDVELTWEEPVGEDDRFTVR